MNPTVTLRALLLAVSALLLLHGPAAAQAAPAEPPVERRLEATFEGATLDGLRDELARAREAGLPTEPLALKALEGRSKGAAEGAILDAVEALRLRLAAAAEVLGQDAGDAALVAGAAALYAGVDRNLVGRVAQGTPEEASAMALVVLGDLVKRGVSISAASDAILRLGGLGADAQTFAEFRGQVERDIRTGVAPGQAAEVRLRGVVVNLGGAGGGR